MLLIVVLICKTSRSVSALYFQFTKLYVHKLKKMLEFFLQLLQNHEKPTKFIKFSALVPPMRDYYYYYYYLLLLLLLLLSLLIIIIMIYKKKYTDYQI